MSRLDKVKQFVRANKAWIAVGAGGVIAYTLFKYATSSDELSWEDYPEFSLGGHAAIKEHGALTFFAADPIGSLRKELARNGVNDLEIEQAVNRFFTDPEAAAKWTLEAFNRTARKGYEKI